MQNKYNISEIVKSRITRTHLHTLYVHVLYTLNTHLAALAAGDAIVVAGCAVTADLAQRHRRLGGAARVDHRRF